MFTNMARAARLGRLTLAGLSAVLVITLTACFDTGDDAEGPTTDTGGAGSNTVVTLAPPPPPVTPATGVVQQQVEPPPPPPTTPATTTTTRSIGDPLIYTINPGDTLFSIAGQFGVSLDDLVALNNIENPDNIRAGDELFIPPPE